MTHLSASYLVLITRQLPVSVVTVINFLPFAREDDEEDMKVDDEEDMKVDDEEDRSEMGESIWDSNDADAERARSPEADATGSDGEHDFAVPGLPAVPYLL